MPGRTPRPGRPRVVPDTGTALPRDQILDAAAALFAEHGVAATSTRMIAERVGIRQASLYYHFAGKDEILLELLTASVRPSLDVVRRIEALVPDRAAADAALYALVVADVRTLVETPHNMGSLYLLPEVQHERYDVFRAERAELQSSYDRLGRAAASEAVRAGLPEGRLGELLIQVTEVVIPLRRARDLETADTRAIADSCLRLCGLPEDAVASARAAAEPLLEPVGSRA